MYFTVVHEEAIVDYCKSSDFKEKSHLYETLIQPALDQMVDKIVLTYKFNRLPNIDSLRDDCKVWLTTVLQKYDPNKGSKAFSYFSVITKNWFIHQTKVNSKKMKREISFESVRGELEQAKLHVGHEYELKREEDEFWSNFGFEMKSWEVDDMRTNDEKVYKAIMILFENANDIEIFNKKAVYLYLRELTGLNTKQVVNNLNKLRKKYKKFKSNWNDGKI